MNIIFHSTLFHLAQWQEAFTSIDPCIKLQPVEDVALDEIEVLLIWKPKITDWRRAKRLKLVVWLGAGIDAQANNLLLPDNVLVESLNDGGMKEAMCDYAHYCVLHFQRRFDHFRQAQQQKHWITKRQYLRKSNTCVGVMGLGNLGVAVAKYLHSMGYQVFGWSRTLKNIEGVQTFSQRDDMDSFLRNCSILINMLPETAETIHLLNHARLSKLPEGAAVVSLSRGGIIDTDALLLLLDDNHLRGAIMDVFEQEPLSQESKLWHHPQVVITPHQSAPTQAYESAKEIKVFLEKCLSLQ